MDRAEQPAKFYQLRPFVVAWFILVAGLLVSALLTGLMLTDARERDQVRFDTLTHLLLEHLDTRVEKYELGLSGLQDLFTEDPLPTHAKWLARVSRLDLSVNHRGLEEVGYAPLLSGDRLQSPDSHLRQLMGEDFRVYPERGGDGVWQPVLYRARQQARALLPLGEELRNSDHEDALRYARSTDSTAVTRAIRFESEDGQVRLAFRLIRPVYQGLMPDVGTSSLTAQSRFDRNATRRNSLYQGAVVGTVVVDEFVGSILEDSKLEVGFRIYDGPVPGKSRQLNQSAGLGAPEDWLKQTHLTNRIRKWRMFGQDWAVEFQPLAEFSRNSQHEKAWSLFLAGTVGSVSLAAIVCVQVRRRLAAEAHASQLAEARDLISNLSKERESLNRDLHDGVLQMLYSLGLGLQKVRKLMRRDVGAADVHLQSDLAYVDQAMAEVRRHLGSVLEEKNNWDLGTRLGELVTVMNRQGPSSVELSMDETVIPKLKLEASMHVLHIARESINNSRRHGGAARIQVRLGWEGRCIFFECQDDGIGFDPSKTLYSGHGLRNMRNRALEMGGELTIASSISSGTTIRLLMQPVSPPSVSQAQGITVKT